MAKPMRDPVKLTDTTDTHTPTVTMDSGVLPGQVPGDVFTDDSPGNPSFMTSPTNLFRRSLKMDPLIPPLRFSLLSLSFRDLSSDNRINTQDSCTDTTPLPRVYSSSHPLPRHLPFLARLQLKTIIALTPKDPLKQVPTMGPWAKAHGIEVKWVKVGTWKDDGTAAISNQVAEETISTLIATSSQPALLVTLTPQPASMILAFLRLVQGYSLPSIQAELHRSLRTGLEGDADDDDVKDCEGWLRSCIGKECSLSLRRSEVQEWVWPDGLLLSGLREQPADGNTSPEPSEPHQFHPTRHGSLVVAPSNPHAPAAHRSATLAYPAPAPPLPSKPRISHPFLKLSFLPETATDQDISKEEKVTESSLPLPTASAPPTTPTQPPQSTMPAPIRMGRKRSQTISEGRGDALSHFMADSAATAAIQSCGIDIGGQSGGPHAALSLNVDPTNFLSISRSVPATGAGGVNTPTTPTFSSSARRPFLSAPQPSYLANSEQQQQQFDDGDADADEDAGDQSTPKAHTRASYMSTAMRTGDGSSSSASGSTYRPPSVAVAAAATARELQADDGSGSSIPMLPLSASHDRLSPHLSPPMSPPDGDETPTKAKLQAQSQLRAEQQRRQQQQQLSPTEYGEDDDQSVTVTAGDDTFRQVRPRGRSRGDSNVTLRVPSLVLDTERDHSPVADSPLSGSPELGSDTKTRPADGNDNADDEEDEGPDDEEEDEAGEGEEEDFHARLEALDLA